MRKIKYSGHKDSVIDIQSNKAVPYFIGTCSDDKTIRLWDIRCNKAVKCIANYSQEHANAIKFHSEGHGIFAITDSYVYFFDIRGDGILVRDPAATYGSFSPKEITSFALHEKGNMIAIGDDEGLISIINTNTNSIERVIHRPHNILIGSLSFRPHNQNNLISGGFDCILCLHDYKRGRIVNSINLSESPESSGQISNPPFIHDLLHLFGGRYVAGAIGDGSVRLYRSTDLSMVSIAEYAHSTMVTSLANSSEDKFFSASLNGDICLWSIQTNSPSHMSDSVSSEVNGNHGRKNSNGKNKSNNEARHSNKSQTNDHLQCDFTIHHNEKINSIATCDYFKSREMTTANDNANTDCIDYDNDNTKVHGDDINGDLTPSRNDKSIDRSRNIFSNTNECVFVADVSKDWTMYILE